MRASVVVSILALVSILASVDSAAAQQSAAQTSVPHLVQFSGVLKDAAARPVVGVTSVTFAIYADQEGGAALWSETQNVLADSNGHYATVLGVATTGGFPTDLFGTGQSRWLGVAIAREPESPRILMASVPYALKAGDAETLGGLPASSYVTTQQLAASNARPATTFINGGGATTAASTQGVTTPSADSAQQSSAIEANPTGSGTTDYVPLWTSGSNLGNSLLFQTSGKLGVGTTSPAATLDINGGEILRGGFYEYPEDNATATNGGRPSHSFQWLASVFNSSTNAAVDYAYGFRAVQEGNNTASPSANLDLFYGTGGPSGTINDTGLSISPTGVVNFVPTQAFNGVAGNLSGTLTLTGATDGLAIVGSGLISTNSPGYYGIIGESSNDDGTAVTGQCTGVGGWGLAADGGAIGIWSEGGVYAGDFDGNVNVSGTLSKSGGSFKIDDPIDPANKYLSHSFVESPDMMNIYNGTVTTDENGFATVTMPSWFESLNRDFRYQLTTVGQFAQAMVSAEIDGGKFTIETDKPNVKVSWQVTGIRQDAWANAHRIPVEEDKAADEKGHYIHPELFGHPDDANITKMLRLNHLAAAEQKQTAQSQ